MGKDLLARMGAIIGYQMNMSRTYAIFPAWSGHGTERANATIL